MQRTLRRGANDCRELANLRLPHLLLYDPIRELAAAAAARDIGRGLYYSQCQDWAKRDADGNTWEWEFSKEGAVPRSSLNVTRSPSFRNC
jgi:hypothetical protein